MRIIRQKEEGWRRKTFAMVAKQKLRATIECQNADLQAICFHGLTGRSNWGVFNLGGNFAILHVAPFPLILFDTIRQEKGIFFITNHERPVMRV